MARIVKDTEFNVLISLLREKTAEYDKMIEDEVCEIHYNQSDVDDMIKERDRLVYLYERMKER